MVKTTQDLPWSLGPGGRRCAWPRRPWPLNRPRLGQRSSWRKPCETFATRRDCETVYGQRGLDFTMKIRWEWRCWKLGHSKYESIKLGTIWWNRDKSLECSRQFPDSFRWLGPPVPPVLGGLCKMVLRIRFQLCAKQFKKLRLVTQDVGGFIIKHGDFTGDADSLWDP